jgi:phosphoglycerate dehydrogenase-like enzyme
MPPLTIVVWDNIGNTLWGVRFDQQSGGNLLRERLPADDPAALDAAPTFAELFAGYEVTLHECKTLEEVEHYIPDADFVVIHKEILPGDVLKKGRKVRLLQHLGLDDRGLPLETAREMGIPCAATPLVNYLAVAEHNWALILNHLKQLPRQRVYMQQRRYVENGWGNLVPLKIGLACDQTLGLLGFGEIARPMARYAQAFGMRTIYWDIRRFDALEAAYGIEYVEWDDLWPQADILTVQIPIKPETHKIIGAREIGLMKPTALFVNTARGRLVDQPALVEALQERRIGGAALDVFYEEPLPPDDVLLDLHDDLDNNVTLTPHSAWQGHWTHVRDSLGIWNNVLHVLRGEPIEHQVGQA